jgi:DNA helicase-2/ATP-dependent DNA helicase PcrA
MAWDDNLSDEQAPVASHTASHARLLAGPGTGKTRVLTQRVIYLLTETGVEPENVVALTFTRAAASELKERVAEAVEDDDGLPRISTFHSFALRQLLKNSDQLQRLPQPLRIAGDWEERYIVLDDLKSDLEHDHIRETRELMNQLAADWQTLSAEEDNYDADPDFVGAWQEHRKRYGYTLRSELIYQLKGAFEEVGELDLGEPIEHLIVDEYQDLNRSELAIVDKIAERGATVYAAGDDDQSIYGFRKAEPAGIRNFPQDFPDSEDLRLETCFRCDENILDLGEFIADLDPQREPKDIYPTDDAGQGEVELLRFPEQEAEAKGIAEVCSELCENGHDPGEILILLRSDRHGAFSSIIIEALEEKGVPVSKDGGESPLESEEAEQVLALLRLCSNNKEDSLAWRTLIQTRNNGLGQTALQKIEEKCEQRKERFYETVLWLAENPGELAQFGNKLDDAASSVIKEVNQLQENLSGDDSGTEELVQEIERLVNLVSGQGDFGDELSDHLSGMADGAGIESTGGLLDAINVSNEGVEQDLASDKVNVITMHKAKGLTSETVFVAGLEDERIPGRAQGTAVNDERRLLYVSITRAKHRLFLTHCNMRTGRQMGFGTRTDKPYRNLCQFVRHAPISSTGGEDFCVDYTA